MNTDVGLALADYRFYLTTITLRELFNNTDTSLFSSGRRLMFRDRTGMLYKSSSVISTRL